MLAMVITSVAFLASQAGSVPTIDVPNDPAARYDVLMLESIGNRKLEIVTRRIGRRGETFVQREIDCANQTFRYLGEGHSIAEMNADDHAYRTIPIDPNAISGHIAAWACENVDW